MHVGRRRASLRVRQGKVQRWGIEEVRGRVGQRGQLLAGGGPVGHGIAGAARVTGRGGPDNHPALRCGRIETALRRGQRIRAIIYDHRINRVFRGFLHVPDARRGERAYRDGLIRRRVEIPGSQDAQHARHSDDAEARVGRAATVAGHDSGNIEHVADTRITGRAPDIAVLPPRIEEKIVVARRAVDARMSAEAERLGEGGHVRKHVVAQAGDAAGAAAVRAEGLHAHANVLGRHLHDVTDADELLRRRRGDVYRSPAAADQHAVLVAASASERHGAGVGASREHAVEVVGGKRREVADQRCVGERARDLGAAARLVADRHIVGRPDHRGHRSARHVRVERDVERDLAGQARAATAAVDRLDLHPGAGGRQVRRADDPLDPGPKIRRQVDRGRDRDLIEATVARAGADRVVDEAARQVGQRVADDRRWAVRRVARPLKINRVIIDHGHEPHVAGLESHRRAALRAGGVHRDPGQRIVERRRDLEIAPRDRCRNRVVGRARSDAGRQRSRAGEGNRLRPIQRQRRDAGVGAVPRYDSGRRDRDRDRRDATAAIERSDAKWHEARIAGGHPRRAVRRYR